MVTVVPCLGCVLGNSVFCFVFCFLRRFRKSVRILKLKVPVFCGSDGISWKGHVTVAPRVLKLKVPVFCGSDGISWKDT